jgi:hypothetical protein
LIIALASVLAIVVIAFVLGVRAKDLPEPEPESPFAHLDERRAAIYENLRDLQFEYRVGKLSDEDYQNTKKGLQKELAAVLAEIDALKGRIAAGPAPELPAKKQPIQSTGFTCSSCGAKFDNYMKFCGECGKPMKADQA